MNNGIRVNTAELKQIVKHILNELEQLDTLKTKIDSTSSRAVSAMGGEGNTIGRAVAEVTSDTTKEKMDEVKIQINIIADAIDKAQNVYVREGQELLNKINKIAEQRRSENATITSNPAPMSSPIPHVDR